MTLTGVGKDHTKMDIDWNVGMKGVPGLTPGIVRGSMSEATDKKPTQIAEEAR
jgi:hypothetical protein